MIVKELINLLNKQNMKEPVEVYEGSDRFKIIHIEDNKIFTMKDYNGKK